MGSYHLITAMVFLPGCCLAFQTLLTNQISRELSLLAATRINRRSLLETAIATTWTTGLFIGSTPALAGIDVSGLRSADSSNYNSAISDQLRAFDGSGTTRIQEIQKTQTKQPSLADRIVASSTSTTSDAKNNENGELSTAATYAYRSAPGFSPRISKAGLYGERFRYVDQLVSPNGKGYLDISFEFPSDWLQLDKILGGIQYVDQRNGDKLYVLRANLPSDISIATAPKKFFGDAIFDPQGTLVRSGITVEGYKIKSSSILSDGTLSAPHRRLLIKYATVTGNGLSTERRALVDAYQIDSVAYMLMTSSNAVKFDAMGRERDTVEAIVDSFRIEKVL